MTVIREEAKSTEYTTPQVNIIPVLGFTEFWDKRYLLEKNYAI